MEKIDLTQFEGREIKGDNGITHTVILPNPQGKMLAEKINEIIDDINKHHHSSLSELTAVKNLEDVGGNPNAI